MQEEKINSHAAITRIFVGAEDDVLDELLSILRREKWENLSLHYERGGLSAERTDMHDHELDGTSEELPLTLALAATWFSADDQVEIMLEIDEPDYDWTDEICAEVGSKLMQEMSGKFKTVTSEDNGHN